jgi:hypothetical protein
MRDEYAVGRSMGAAESFGMAVPGSRFAFTWMTVFDDWAEEGMLRAGEFTVIRGTFAGFGIVIVVDVEEFCREGEDVS